jgi:hypothetical protein
MTLNETGEMVTNGKTLQNSAESDYYEREKLTVSSRQPVIGSDGDLTKLKVKGQIVRPSVLASGKVNYNLIRIEMEVHPEDGAAVTDNLRQLGVEFLLSSDADNFFNSGSIS